MADWYGSARSNYFTPTDLDALKEALAPWPILISPGDGDKVCLLSDDDEFGGWPVATRVSRIEVGEDGGETKVEDEVDFDFAKIVMPHVVEGEVVVLMECGAEGLRYLTGNADAFIRTAEGVQETHLNLNDIFGKAIAAFGDAIKAPITDCIY